MKSFLKRIGLAAAFALAFVSAADAAGSYPSPTFQNITLAGQTGYCYANGVSPVVCATTVPLSAISGIGSTLPTSLANAQATTSNIWAGSANHLLDAGQVFNAAGALQALTGTTSVAPNFSTGFNFSFTATSADNYTLNNPTNMKVGQSGCFDLFQPATGTVVTIAFGADWYFSGGTAPTLTATLGAEDLFCYWVKSSSVVVGTMISNIKP